MTAIDDLTDAQRAHLEAAAATLRPSDRAAFRADMMRLLSRLGPRPTDEEVVAVIAATIGIVPVDDGQQ
jgi:hypothetical protein